ncbi:hypothetical protein N0V95_000500 [Ascochyta clinopodiicola]|nr:hypothetical protein N0V95_000500 [Ascochyta clinopodiicola]
MAPKTPSLSSRFVGGTSKPPQQTPSSSSTIKRPRNDGTSTSPVLIDSDDNDETPAQRSAPSSKRTKTNRAAIAPSKSWKSDTSDNEPLIDRLKMQTSTSSKKKVADSMSQFVSHLKTPSSLHSTVAAESAQPSPDYDRNLNTNAQNVGHVELPTRQTPVTPATIGSVYGRKTNLTSAFKSASSGVKPASRPNHFATNFLSLRKVSSPDRKFTNMRLKEVNKLILAVGKAKGGNNDRSPDAEGRTQRELQDSGEIFEELPVFQSIEMPEEVVMTDVGSPGGFEMFSDADVDGTDDESDSTMVADSEDEYNASPVAAGESRMGKEVIEIFYISQQQSRVSRAARLTPATEVIEVIDRTEDEPVAQQTLTRPTAQSENLSLADRLFPKSPTPPPPPERPETTATREAAFLRGFKTQWWDGGLSLFAATRTVNAALAPRIPQFSEQEGKHRLLALFAKKAVAIRHGLVYHPDCDPGPDAPPQTPKPPRQDRYVSSAQKIMQDSREGEASSSRSVHGKISAPRFRVFEMKLHSAVEMEKTLFQDGLELVGRCVEVLNEWMGGDNVFTEKEVRAAFVSLAKRGKVRFEGDVVALVGLE